MTSPDDARLPGSRATLPDARPDARPDALTDGRADWSTARFAVGQPVPRTEDPVLVRGAGRYTDDIGLPGQAHAVMVRSPHPHGLVRGIDTAAARAMPGVLAVYTAADLAGCGTLKCVPPLKSHDGTAMVKPARPPLATDRVRFVGDPVAVVVAETAVQARDAAEAVTLDIAPLPAVTTTSAAIAEGAPVLYPEAPRNVALDWRTGDSEKVAAAFAGAAHVVRLDLTVSRVVVAPLEPRAAVAAFDPESGRFTLHLGCQGAFGMRGQIADLMQVPVDRVHILTGHVGGSFGMKSAAFPEYACVLHAARALGRPVKWTEERSASFLSDTHGRDQERTAELALDARGRFLALRLTGHADMGAYLGLVAPLPPTVNALKNVASVYRTPLIEVRTLCVFTNTTPVAAYRGAGRPEGNYIMERLIDVAARQTGIDRLTLRRRNHVRPKDLPYVAASQMTYDSGDFPAVFERALAAADWAGFAARRRASRKAGRLRGIGIGSYLEVTAPASPEMGGLTFAPDGTVTFTTGTLDYGQGHATPFAQVIAERLGIPFERIRLRQGDSDALIAGGGTGGSRSSAASGTAAVEACARVIEQGRAIAAAMLEAGAADIEFAHGRFTVAGTDLGIGLIEIAQRLSDGFQVPDGVPQTLDVALVSPGAPSTFPNGCHVAEVEIDIDTGVPSVVRYVSVNDFGTVLNPMIVDGQIHGGVVQGIGQAFWERVVYDADGQLLTGSLADYALPHAADVPAFDTAYHPVPTASNPLGVKGCGEAGCAGALVAVTNATIDALAEHGVRHVDMPLTSETLWRIIHGADAAA
ncbi:xanthine dehydrogenase family protein molybdopterin-binding subunit [Rhodoplanes sp. TEM]|uniref:Xanthine dehydrogenase family protein molybdopterin-binding subunit n=1 Tax=Rhodoplanes tepidamans TaxID=200616 RepID=A0ABT5JFF5_RHOTP|nr:MULTISPECIES: xanthine dehydrogenase family protein molybdopterin-binding subunit [Rhodoplanes]MDC7788148.1 xanthine dehydrogenase family protein molybdopterin-binding subunit [Rhodoplanes tepidamans]MDC7987260.1 xanthine dehydrogenase family protein molybdopterin-binding subunit [Rhodoplanes sp. TEM]MDQ0355162.1 carbon-monoxide dehydrogenase large subunit [Rhodoplanes tepidamans]